MERTHRNVVVVEKNKSRAEKLIEKGHYIVEGDTTSDQTLNDIGIEKAAGLVTALSDDRDNLFVVIPHVD